MTISLRTELIFRQLWLQKQLIWPPLWSHHQTHPEVCWQIQLSRRSSALASWLRGVLVPLLSSLTFPLWLRVTSIFLFLLLEWPALDSKSNFLTSKKLSPCFYHLKLTSDDEHDRFLILHISCFCAVEKGGLGGVFHFDQDQCTFLSRVNVHSMFTSVTHRHKQSPSPPKGRCLLICCFSSPGTGVCSWDLGLVLCFYT